MSEMLSPILSRENTAVLDRLQARLREIAAARQADADPSPAVRLHLRPSPKMLDDAEAAAGVSRVQAAAQQGADVTGVHNGLDPQRVAKLLGLAE